MPVANKLVLTMQEHKVKKVPVRAHKKKPFSNTTASWLIFESNHSRRRFQKLLMTCQRSV